MLAGGSRTAQPAPRHLRRRPVGLRAGLPLAQSAAKCKGKPRRWRGGAYPLAFCGRRALSRPRAHKPFRAARPLPLAAYRWPHLGGARPPGPVTGLGRLARPGLYNGPYSGARALGGPRAHSRAPGGGHCSQRWARYRGLIIWGRCPQPPGAATPQAARSPYLDTLVTTHAQKRVPKIAKNGITKAPVTC